MGKWLPPGHGGYRAQDPSGEPNSTADKIGKAIGYFIVAVVMFWLVVLIAWGTKEALERMF